jgi:hypothetical protein
MGLEACDYLDEKRIQNHELGETSQIHAARSRADDEKALSPEEMFHAEPGACMCSFYLSAVSSRRKIPRSFPNPFE